MYVTLMELFAAAFLKEFDGATVLMKAELLLAYVLAQPALISRNGRACAVGATSVATVKEASSEAQASTALTGEWARISPNLSDLRG